MNEQNQQTANATSPVNDLSVAANEAGEIKGGPKRIFIGGLSVEETQTVLPDLEPKGEIKGGPGSGAGGVWLNHNETVQIDEDDVETARLTDLKASEEQEEQVKGGTGNTYYVGTANGGVWKTTDGGRS